MRFSPGSVIRDAGFVVQIYGGHVSNTESLAVQSTEQSNSISSVLVLHLQLLKLSTLVGQPMREIVAQPHDISNDALKVMVCLADMGSATGIQMSELLAIHPMSASRAITHLEAKGWVEPADGQGDRRKRPVRLSEEGLKAFRAIGPTMARVAERLYGKLNRREQIQLQKLLERVLESDLLNHGRN